MINRHELPVASRQQMPEPPRPRNPQLTTRNFLPAFTFIEVLFAVILLGIGFIMIAAIFPVAIQQTALVSNETQASAVERDAIKKIQAVADGTVAPGATYGQTNSLLQPTLRTVSAGVTVPVIAAFSYQMNQAFGADTFFSADHRFGWVGFYRRDSVTSPYAQVFIVALQNPNFASYSTTAPPGLSSPASPPPPNASPVSPPIPPVVYNYEGYGIPTGNAALSPIYPWGTQSPTSNPYLYVYTSASATPAPIIAGYPAKLLPPDANGISYIQFASVTSAVTGAFVLIADDGTNASKVSPPPPPLLTGRFLRLGAVQSDGVTYALEPGNDVSAADLTQLNNINGNTTAAVNVFVIGSAPTLPQNPPYSGDYDGPFTGANQDIGVSSAMIRVNTANN